MEAWVFWTVAAVCCLAFIAAVRGFWERRQRSAFVEGLSHAELEWLLTFEIFKGTWRDFRDLRHRDSSAG